MNIEYKNVSALELQELVIKFKLNIRDRFSNIYKDFHYFSFYDIYNYYGDVNNVEFIIAIDIDSDTIVGVLKHSLEISKYYWCDAIKTDDIYTSMRYIDVKEGYKGLGIGKTLIQRFNNYIDKTIPLMVSEESDDGKIIGSHKMFQKYINNTIIVLRESYGVKTID